MESGMSDHPVLWHIAISHYSEKVRWALEYKSVEHERRAPPPGLHMAVTLWLTRGQAFTVPVLELDGARIADSTAIIAALEQRFPEPPLYPADPEERRRALELEEWFDEELGPYTRRLAFHELRRDPELLDQIAARVTPRLSAALGRALVPYTRAYSALRYGAASSSAAETARQKIVAAFDRLETELGEHEYLVGGRFTVADLTAAALLYPIVRPPEAPATTDRMPESYERFRDTLRERRGYRWVQEIFRWHRHTQPPRIPQRNEQAREHAGHTAQ
jgi:glutathione S-transferase